MTCTRRYTKNKMGQTRMMMLGHVLGHGTTLVEFSLDGGEGGIRTPDTLASMPHFECGAFNHSATSPEPEKGLKRPCMDGRYLTKRAMTDKGRTAYIAAILQ